MKQEDIMKLEAAIAADYGNIAGMVVRKDGETVYERYFGGCTAESRLNVFSVTKSIVSILLGIALDRGCLGNIDQQVLEFFSEYTPKRGEKTIQNILALAIPLGSSLLGSIAEGLAAGLLNTETATAAELYFDNEASLVLGLMFLLGSLLCRYGAEQKEA